VLGEAAKATLAADPSVASALPEIEWSPIARMRDRVAHHYWATDPEVVWATATVAVPALCGALASALARLGEAADRLNRALQRAGGTAAGRTASRTVSVRLAGARPAEAAVTRSAPGPVARRMASPRPFAAWRSSDW
jgi:Protein of unknown function DUF86